MTYRTQIWSSGGGVQSTAIAALIVQGKLPKPDLAVIADTEREKRTTWSYMDAVTLPALASVGVILHRVQKSKYATVDLYGGESGNDLLIPAFTTQSGDIGKLPAFCSNEWKRRVVQRWATREHGVKAAMMWIGYTTDEPQRPRTTTGKWQERYPLIELNRSRGDCLAIVEAMGWPTPPRSACWMCPNQGEEEWGENEQLPQATVFEDGIRKRDPNIWLHSSAIPLRAVKFDQAQDVMFRKGCQTGLCFV